MISNDVLALVGNVNLARWNVAAPIGTPIVVTYSFADDLADYVANFYTGFQSFNDTHRSYARTALDTWAAAGGIHFVEVPDSLGGQIRFSFVDMSGMLNATGNPLSGFAYYPGYQVNSTNTSLYISVDDNVGGDVFMNTAYYAGDAATMAPGIRGYSILLHEIGHALGFKHPFDGDPTITPAHDNGAYTVMSYDRSRSTTQLGSVDLEAVRYYYGDADFTVSFDALNHVVSVTGTSAGEWMVGTELDDIIFGLGGNDTIRGESGNDELNGGVGSDRMIGGAGNDSYYVDNVGDTTIEMSGEGTDTVFSSVNFELWAQSQHIENLTLIGGANLNGVGNALANTLTGNAGNNVLNGGVGADRMVGGGGDDSYYVDNVGDTTIEMSGEGTDTVFSSVNFELWAQSQQIENLTLIGGANLNGVGNALGNTLTGNAGNNVLNGGVGADRMVGGAGNDTYHVDNAGDTTIETSGQGTDSVISSVSYFLWNQSQYIENLTLIGTGNIDGGGNGLANTLTGNAGNNVLNGGGNADRMVGGAGNDTYHVDNAGDTAVEWNGQGIDTVISSIGFALKDQNQFLENLTLAGSGNINGTGNGLANTINGNSGNNILNGAWGNDTLNGGAGNDIFNDDGGIDRMVGGLGDDIYYVGNVGDTTIEVAGQGMDTVFSSVDYFLWEKSQHIENLTLIGTANIDGGGNGLANTITGNAGNNVLNGGGGADRMVGGQGNDTYYVDNFGDTTIEQAGEGTDLVMTSVGFALRDQSQHIENLTLDGTGHIYGTGNGLANTITGNSGNNGLNGAWGDDTLIGGAGDDIFRDDAGNDIFTGGTGADTFFFLSAGESDRITDFEDGIDTMTIGLGVNSFAGITVTDSGADTILTFGSNTVTLENFDHTLVSSDDFTFA